MTKLEHELREMKKYLDKWAKMSPPLLRDFLDSITKEELISYLIRYKCTFNAECLDSDEMAEVRCIRCWLAEDDGNTE